MVMKDCSYVTFKIVDRSFSQDFKHPVQEYKEFWA